MTSKKNQRTNRKPRRINQNAGARRKGSVEGYYIANGKMITLRKNKIFGI